MKRTEFISINKDSAFKCKELNVQSDLLAAIESDKFSQQSKNKKSETFNVEIHENDLIALDKLAEELQVSRSKLLTYFMTEAVCEIFFRIPHRDKYMLANHVDEYLTDNGHEHMFENMTWDLMLKLNDISSRDIDWSMACEESFLDFTKKEEE